MLMTHSTGYAVLDNYGYLPLLERFGVMAGRTPLGLDALEHPPHVAFW
jgi:hypothetical protein